MEGPDLSAASCPGLNGGGGPVRGRARPPEVDPDVAALGGAELGAVNALCEAVRHGAVRRCHGRFCVPTGRSSKLRQTIRDHLPGSLVVERLTVQVIPHIAESPNSRFFNEKLPPNPEHLNT